MSELSEQDHNLFNHNIKLLVQIANRKGKADGWMTKGLCLICGQQMFDGHVNQYTTENSNAARKHGIEHIKAFLAFL